MFDSLQLHGYTVYGLLHARILEWVASSLLSPGDLPSPGIDPRSPTLQADSLPAEPPGKPKNAGVRSLSLLQGIFPTQESYRSLLHCRWILNQLNYKASLSPKLKIDPKTKVQEAQRTRGKIIPNRDK